MNKYIIIITFIITLTLWSCNTTTTEPDAIQMSVEQLAETPGYTWMYELLTTYQPDSIVEKNIGALLDTNRDKFIIFARAACSCPTEKKEFAQLIKILRDLHYPTKFYEVYAMSSKTNPNPYSNIITLKDIPAVIYMRNGVPYYSIIDTLYNNVAKGLKYPVRLEDVLYEALKN
ncbi:MAG: hypothetical protein ACPL1A_00350 [Candidatus Kapaibacteriota bacterium]